MPAGGLSNVRFTCPHMAEGQVRLSIRSEPQAHDLGLRPNSPDSPQSVKHCFAQFQLRLANPRRTLGKGEKGADRRSRQDHGAIVGAPQA